MAERRDEISDTIRQRIISGLHLGTLRAGSRLPSTREIADEFHVAPRTAMVAYRVLEAEGLVELRERSGIYVAPGGGGEAAMLTQLAGWVVEVLLDGRAREISPIDFPERVRRCLETLRLRAACIAGNEDQMDQIRYELASDYGIESDAIEPTALQDQDVATQRLLSRADLIVSTAAHAVEVHQVARRLGKVAITVALRSELMAEMTRQLAVGPVVTIGSDPRFRDAVRRVFAPTGYGDNAHVLILGEDDVSRIPSEVPVYIMRRAHERLRDPELAARFIPIRRVFSRDMARELLTFIVRANMTAMSGRANGGGSENPS